VVVSRVARLLVTLLGVVLLASLVPGSPATAMAPGQVHLEDGLTRAIDVMNHLATDSRHNKKQKRTTRPRKGLPVKLGRDGRLTVLLLGSDWRPEAGGERTDVIMVATIDPLTKRAAVVSIPRDMSDVPLAGGGTSGSLRVNGIYYIRYRDPSLPHAAVDKAAMKRFSKDIATFLGTEIDYWAMVRFGTFANVINQLGGIRVDVEEEVLDTSYHHGASRGVWFPQEDGYRLKGDPKCKPKPRKCRSALVYARSRKGTMGSRYNSDYTRAERQQDIVLAGVRKVLDEWGSGLPLLGLLGGVRQHVETNLPTTVEAAAQLYALLDGVRLPESNARVLSPPTWAVSAPSYAIRPKVSDIRAWVDKAFYKVTAAEP
jgi:anionic cell wall polymer biosynthesis LytR-Cps2A-Psr (LCP) family protein